MTSTSDIDGERCPFCWSLRIENLYDRHGSVHCIDCGARGPIPERLERKLGRDVNTGLDAWMCRKGEKWL